MRTARQVSWAALALTCASLCLGPARAQGTEVYDGITYAQFKSILSQTKLGLAESVTQKGNRYLTVTVPGATAPFVATVMDCSAGQDQPCEGFAYLYIETRRPMNASAMVQFSKDTSFVKATPAIVDPSHSVITGEFYARGGVTPQYVTHAGAFYTAVLESFLKGSGAIAMNGRTTPALTFAKPMRPEQFFADLAAKGGGKPALAGATAPVIDEALIDALNGGRR